MKDAIPVVLLVVIVEALALMVASMVYNSSRGLAPQPSTIGIISIPAILLFIAALGDRERSHLIYVWSGAVLFAVSLMGWVMFLVTTAPHPPL